MRAIPTRYRIVTAPAVLQSWWKAIDSPVGLAFVFYHSSLQRFVRCHPSPHGLTETSLSLDEEWIDRFHAALEPDVEALLCWEHDRKVELFLVPIDACFALVGQLRQGWGDAGKQALSAFFAHLRARSEVVAL
ncbi:MAG: hypothetical protein C4345_01105 [Chloroflexota bacterium]